MTQESRQVEILRPAVKELIRVEMTARIPELVRRAGTITYETVADPSPGPRQVVIQVAFCGVCSHDGRMSSLANSCKAF